MELASTAKSDCAFTLLPVFYLFLALASETLIESVNFFEAKFFVKFGRLRFKLNLSFRDFGGESYNRLRFELWMF